MQSLSIIVGVSGKSMKSPVYIPSGLKQIVGDVVTVCHFNAACFCLASAGSGELVAVLVIGVGYDAISVEKNVRPKMLGRFQHSVFVYNRKAYC